MCFTRSKAVRLFCAICFLFGSFLVDSACAKDDWSLLFQIPLMTSRPNVVKRKVSGYVHLNNSGLADVGIYDRTALVAETNSQGYYETMLLAGLPYTLTAQKSGYQFTPPSITISGSKGDLENQNFSAEKLAVVTISGNVIWKNSGYDLTIRSNPLPLVAVEAYTYTDCYDEDTYTLHTRAITDVDGNYSISLPVGWCGYIEPFWETGVGFFPQKQTFYRLKEDQVRDFLSPNNSDVYTITVSIKDPNGDLLPLSQGFRVDLDGIDYAFGSHDHTYLVVFQGECTFRKPHGYIGQVTPSVYGGTTSYSIDPPFIRMNGILSSDREFKFTATEN